MYLRKLNEKNSIFYLTPTRYTQNYVYFGIVIFNDNTAKKIAKIVDGKFDLIFIDGGHTYSIVENDSNKAFKMVKPRGIILWHDYVPGKTSDKDVVKYLNNISKDKKIFHIDSTLLFIDKKFTQFNSICSNYLYPGTRIFPTDFV